MDQPASLCFIDTETTSLRPDRRAWEIAVILRRPGQPDQPRRWFVSSADLDLGNADLTSLRIGGFFSRHPDYQPRAGRDPAAGSDPAPPAATCALNTRPCETWRR